MKQLTLLLFAALFAAALTAAPLADPAGLKEIWVDVAPVNGGINYHVEIVEREAMKQDVLANAQVFAARF